MKSMSDFWVGIFVLLGIISIVFLSFRVGSYNSFDKKNILLGMIYGSAIASFTIESFGTNKIFNLSKQEIDNRYKILKKIAKII